MSGPRFVSMTWRPEQGMRMLQAVADLPGIGETELLTDETFGGALLIPFANRIRGCLQPDGTIATRVLGRDIRLPANWRGKRPGAERCAMHGLVLDSTFTLLEQSTYRVIAALDAGGFGGHWLSRASIRVEAVMWATSIGIVVDVRNCGDDVLPVGIGWHPYFRIPSGRRDQVRVHLPARQRALVNNYDDVFPTGTLAPVRGTPYDFSAPDGAPLGSQYFDDCFVGLVKTPAGETRIDVRDDASGYHMRLTALSPEVHAVQMYAPSDKPFVVLEPQFNLADPFGGVWASNVDTGMKTLQPGDEARWAVRWEIL
jgi:galactose mutarotase-like enzyme